jgi:hypothetical protein
VPEDGSHSPPELKRAEFMGQASRLRALAADASPGGAREHFTSLAETYDRLAATYDKLADTSERLGLIDPSEKSP